MSYHLNDVGDLNKVGDLNEVDHFNKVDQFNEVGHFNDVDQFNEVFDCLHTFNVCEYVLSFTFRFTFFYHSRFREFFRSVVPLKSMVPLCMFL